MLLRSIVAAGGKEKPCVRLIDCLIASTAIRAGVPILHNDADFEVLARHTELEIYGDSPN